MGTAGTLEHQASTRKMLSSRNSNDSVEMQKRFRLSEKWIAVLFTVVASLGYLSIGSMVAWSSNAFVKVQGTASERNGELRLLENEEFSPNEKTSLAATPALTAAVCSVVVYKLYPLAGTKLFMLTAAALMIGANFLLTFGTSFWYFCAGRLMAGISAGIITTLVPPYVDEFASKQYKPLLDAILYVQFAFGILIQLMSDQIPITKLASLIGTIFPVFLFIGFLFMPESARYLATTQQVMENNLTNWQQPRFANVNLLESLRKLQNTRLVVPTLVLVVFQQFVGAIPMMFNLSGIFNLTGSLLYPEYTAICVAAIFTLSIPTYRLLCVKIGDYKLLVWSSLLMAVAMGGLGWHCHVQGITGHSGEHEHIPLVCFGVFVFLYAIGFQQVPWRWLDTIVEEENALPVRTIATCLSWVSLYICVRLLPFLFGMIGAGWLFWNITIIALFAVLFVLIAIPNLDRSVVAGKSLVDCSGSSSSSSSSNLGTEENLV
ncbi:facilitated trehalose transporter Tret1-like isoform X2 [Toxorhynchites rutilus septentrionalis]|uniref:facilitated trehalose transporter Tret1-like isoform X2 n=1 Tax=Toxorhynchites rutilus septentrionalis TaxID=329112 RepID=UPI00247AB513|nr:facilitated trehalose transporter Tret1-like isoform X2 [Toxorhynchites rutilus septentrionalis]